MGKKLDKLMADMSAELEGGNTEPEKTPAAEPAPETKPEPEPKKDPEPAPAPAEEPHDEPPADGGEPEKDKPAREIPDDPVKRAEFSFKRQLTKQKEKHERELKERDDKYNAVMKELEELKKQMAPKKEPLTRDKFKDDEEFIHALNKEDIDRAFAERDEAQAKKDAERAEQDRQRQEQERELEKQQQEWLSNVDQAFDGDNARAKKFLDRVKFCNDRGLGEVLDNCPVAADYLIHDPMGPVVFEKLLDDRKTFERVFDPRRTSPLSIYYELREVEKELRAAPPAAAPAPEAAPAAQPARKPIPNLGRPGRQAGASSMTATDMFSDPKAVKQWLREHR
jgi:hypothetical protein